MAVQGKPIRPGSSPHVRGALTQCVVRHDFLGIIPACAGSTNMVDSWYDQVRDHPRMCGEHPIFDHLPVKVTGSSPHVRGAP